MGMVVGRTFIPAVNTSFGIAVSWPVASRNPSMDIAPGSDSFANEGVDTVGVPDGLAGGVTF